MLRPIDAYTLNNALMSWYNDTEDETEKSILRRVMQMVVHAPTLTPPNEPLTLEHLRASPHGKIKDSTLQSICNRANEIACRPPEGEEN